MTDSRPLLEDYARHQSEAAFGELGTRYLDLKETDRTAILLSFFEQRDFRAVGQALGSSEEASRKRVSRALDKLRALLARRGIRTTAAALSAAVATNAVQTAPAGLAAKISATLLLGTSATSAASITGTATKTMALTTLQEIAVIAALTATVGAGIYEAREGFKPYY